MASPTANFLAALILAMSALAVPALADDVVYPPGSRLGLVPPKGMVPSASFQGYEDSSNQAAIIMTALPQQAYAALEKEVTADSLKREGVTLEKREQMSPPIGPAFLVIGQQTTQGATLRKWVMAAGGSDVTALISVQVPDKAKDAYPDTVIRDALATLTLRASVPDEENLSLLPFTLADLAGFKIAAAMPGRAVLLSDAPADGSDLTAAPHLVVAIGADSPAQAEEREAFAVRVFRNLTNLKDTRILASEPLRLGGQPGHQILAEAKDAQSNADLMVVQWLRFGGGVHIQMVGTARTDAWTAALARFRTVRDGLAPR
jgi:hypothetical protein